MDIQEYLESKDIRVKQRGSADISVPCFFHGEDEGNDGRLYINIDESDDKFGLWHCFVCAEKGNLNKLRAHFGDAPLQLNPDQMGAQYNPIVERYAQYCHERLFENKEAYDYLTIDRGLTDKTIVQARLGWDDNGAATYLLQQGFTPEEIQETTYVTRFSDDKFKNQITFPNLDYGRATQVRGKPIGGVTMGTALPVQLYGTDNIIGEPTVIIAEGEIDTLTLTQLGYAACGVPGVQTFKDEWLDFFSEAKRIYIMFDQDNAGRVGAEKLATKIGARARVVELPKKGIDVNDWHIKYGKNREDFDYLLHKAKGGLLVTVHEAYERWTEIEGNPDREVGIRFNVKALDNAMASGGLPGQLMTMIAKTNSGKTIMSINYFERMRRLNPELKILYVSLEQTRNEWFERAYRIRNFYEPGTSVVDFMKSMENHFMMVDKSRVTREQLADTIEQYSYEQGQVPDVTCIDYFGYYARGADGNSEYERVTEAIFGLKETANEFQTFMYAPHQSNRSGDFGKELEADQGRGGGTVEETSDIMLSLWAPDQQSGVDADTAKGEIHQKILKSRNAGVGTLARYQFAPLTLAMVPIDDVLYERAMRERLYAQAGDTWRQAVNRHAGLIGQEI